MGCNHLTQLPKLRSAYSNHLLAPPTPLRSVSIRNKRDFFSPQTRVSIKGKVTRMRTEISHENKQRRNNFLILVATEDGLEISYSLFSDKRPTISHIDVHKTRKPVNPLNYYLKEKGNTYLLIIQPNIRKNNKHVLYSPSF